ncbi:MULTISPECIES: alpha/beta fold hydrolase [Streptomyces albovinaceus subgroup]|uniref:alpha/beta fold hydrolase n=1 Tax=Streptomyces albovinaceus subgroup TaxID=1482558 RepID=UPI0004C811F4|nr:hypothetical protein [Streptomyces mediolani]
MPDRGDRTKGELVEYRGQAAGDPSSVHRYDTVATARIEQLPDVGHLPMFEAPETTGELLRAFAVAGR